MFTCVRLVALAVASLSAAACGKESSSGSDLGATRVRFVHAIADTGSVDVRINATLRAALTAVSYGDATAYEAVSGGVLTFSVQPSPSTSGNTPRALANLGGISVPEGSVLTVVASGDARDTVSQRAPALTAYRDDLLAPAAGQARLRVINSSSDAGAVDVYATATGGVVSGSPTFAGVDTKSQVTKSLAAGAYTLTITALAEPTRLLATSSVILPDGGAQTVVIRGYSGPLPAGLSTARRLTVSTMVNRAP